MATMLAEKEKLLIGNPGLKFPLSGKGLTNRGLYNNNPLIAMPKDEVIRRIKETLDQKGVTQSHLAKKLGMSKSNISKIMRGERKLTVETLLQIARILDVDPASLIPSAQIDTKKLTFEEYVREIIRSELSTEKRHT